jgi:hypothetical protein
MRHQPLERRQHRDEHSGLAQEWGPLWEDRRNSNQSRSSRLNELPIADTLTPLEALRDSVYSLGFANQIA